MASTVKENWSPWRLAPPRRSLEDVYFTWGTVSDAARYAKVIDKLKEYVAVHFWDQATVAARAMEELKPPVFVKSERSVRVYWNKRNAGSTVDNVPKSKD